MYWKGPSGMRSVRSCMSMFIRSASSRVSTVWVWAVCEMRPVFSCDITGEQCRAAWFVYALQVKCEPRVQQSGLHGRGRLEQAP